ncbi:MAG: class I SAM-dependent methyltransferase [Hyphomicrobiaceae bacterium]|nr:class I SAM-dependent methyltransferase [Hyphomicrobiaceae bacterium]
MPKSNAKPPSPAPLIEAVYGSIPDELVEVPPSAVQCAPRVPGARLLSDMAPGSLARLVMYAPPSTIERRHEIALALRALAPGAALTVVAANSKGGNRLADEVAAFGCAIAASHRRKHRIIDTQRPEHPSRLDDALASGLPRLLSEMDLWTQPGLFSWDRLDPGSALLATHLPTLSGRGADLGCGIGVLARAVRQRSPEVASITLIDIDARALDMALRNVPGTGVTTLWADVRTARNLPTLLDFVVMNPPFHDGGAEDRALGQVFIAKAAGMLRPGGVLWLTANRHLPYEATLKTHFASVTPVADGGGYKIVCAEKAARAPRLDRSAARTDRNDAAVQDHPELTRTRPKSARARPTSRNRT